MYCSRRQEITTETQRARRRAAYSFSSPWPLCLCGKIPFPAARVRRGASATRNFEDPKQQRDIASQQPELLARLKKKLLAINASVMADGHDWHLK